MKKTFLLLLPIIWLGCSQSKQSNVSSKPELNVKPENFEKTIDGKPVRLYVLENSKGTTIAITNYGGRIVSIIVPDKNSNFDDINLGYSSLDDYINYSEQYFGALIGRYGNRIGKGRFVLEGTEYTLATNNGPNHLHGGIKGFNDCVWDVAECTKNTLTLDYMSKDMEEGYPGNLNTRVKYSLTEENELRIDYQATTDKKTILNLTNHSYFNLAGEGSGKTILDHEIIIYADNFTPVDANLIPTGEIIPVAGTPFDFRQWKPIGRDLGQKDQQLEFGKGYDHNFVLNKPVPNQLTLAAKAKEPTSGRIMEVYTTEPGVQFYIGNFLAGEDRGKSGKPYLFRTAFCLETQHFPDSPNKPNFPSATLNPGETFVSTTIYKFSVGD